MTVKDLKQKLAAGERVYGSSIVSLSPRWPGAVATIGLDFVFLDTEHPSVDRERVSWMCQAYRAVGLPPIVRIPAPDPYQACMVLDGGAAGVIAPYVETVEQVRAHVGAVKWRPLKGERLSKAMDDPATLEPKLRQYLEVENENHLCVINIESVPAIRDLDRLLGIPGIDVLLIGPHDLSCSLGHPEEYSHPDFDRAAKTIADKARAKGVSAGIHSFMGVERDVDFARMGFNFIVRDADVRTFPRAAKEELKRLKGLLGEK